MLRSDKNRGIHAAYLFLLLCVLIGSWYFFIRIRPYQNTISEADYIFVYEYSNEFNAESAFYTYWHATNPEWQGRPPALFKSENVALKRGKLMLFLKEDTLDEKAHNLGYRNYSSAAIKSKEQVLYGYFEVKARTCMNRVSSAFWFYEENSDYRIDINVFELLGNTEYQHRKLNSSAGVSYLPDSPYDSLRFWQDYPIYRGELPFVHYETYHVYGLLWDKDSLIVYADGIKQWAIANQYWHYPVTINFDIETMPEWTGGMPIVHATLPGNFSIDYLRVWQLK
jgi:beta-glucanase (GH16 family)